MRRPMLLPRQACRRISHQDFQLLGLIGEIGWMPLPGITVKPIGSAVRMVSLS
jgi:hypothetical protein